MPRGVAIETSGQVGSVATVLDGRVLDEQIFPHGLRHAASLVPLIDRMCRAEGWSPRDIDELYVSVGPGSFTGLRIAVTLAKTMALATGVKLVAVPTMQVLACNAPVEARHVVIILDAKRDQIFTARFARAEGTDPWSTEEPAHLGSLPSMIARSPRPLHLIGEGIEHHRQHIPAQADVIETPPESWRARATTVAVIGYGLARDGAFGDPLRFAPAYVRLPEAQEKWEAMHGSASQKVH